MLSRTCARCHGAPVRRPAGSKTTKPSRVPLRANATPGLKPRWRLRVASEPMNSKCCNRSFDGQHCMISDYKSERRMPFERGKERRRFELIIHTMCTYTDVLYSCGCCGPPVCDKSCSQIMSELDRINHPEAWEGEGLNQLPFDMADECVPSWHNALFVRETAVCDHFWGDGCLPQRKVPAWIAPYAVWPEQTLVPWPEQTLGWSVNNVELAENHAGWPENHAGRPEYDVGWQGMDGNWSADNAEWMGYDLELLENFPAWLEFDPAMLEYDPAGPTSLAAQFLSDKAFRLDGLDGARGQRLPNGERRRTETPGWEMKGLGRSVSLVGSSRQKEEKTSEYFSRGSRVQQDAAISGMLVLVLTLVQVVL
ncbi:hypothetical protein TgHK011_006724 [Trichoderma gracile]|nr:hypothetical protein TgHK011_006724 [Trichoderma gracile]